MLAPPSAHEPRERAHSLVVNGLADSSTLPRRTRKRLKSANGTITLFSDADLIVSLGDELHARTSALLRLNRAEEHQ